MFTEYNSQNVYENPVSNEKQEKPNRFFSFLWKILLVIIVLVLLFLVLIKTGVISLTSSIAPEAIILNTNEVGIKKGKTYQLVSTILPDNANNKQVVWTSSDPDIVSVNEVSGYIEGLKEGTAVITVRTLINDKTSECIVNVTDRNILVNDINVNEKYVSLAVGYTQSLTYQTSPSNATELNLKFSSSDSSVATVSANGIVTGVKEGSAIITVSSANGAVRDTSYVTVYKTGTSTVSDGESIRTETYPESINILSESANLSVGTTSQLIAEVSPSNTNQSISWSSSNSNVVTVDSNGLLTAKGVGTATIVAKTINNITDTCQVTVGNYSLNLRSILITTDYSVLPIGSKKQLVVAFNPSNATNKTVTWSSNNASVATVDSSGNVKAISPGSAIITARSSDGGYTDTAIIEVVNYDNLVEEKTLSFASSSYSIGVNQTVTLNPIITPSNATFKAVEFQSSNASIATVDENGVVRGIAPGTATITATTKRNGIKASVSVTVRTIASTSVSLNSTKVSINRGDTFSLIATVNPSNATNQTVTFKSDNPSIATIDSNGIITGISSGTATITVTPNGGGTSSTCLVTIN